MSEFTEFDYLLNRFEHASQADKPADFHYATHRASLFAYVRNLESQAAQPKREPLTDVVRSVDAGFRWDSVAQCHIPQLVVEFDPVPANGPSDAPGWQARDACAAMLSERLTLGEQG